MKKIFAYILLLFLMTIYVISCSNKLSENFTDVRDNGIKFFSHDKFRYGDLFGISFLPEYKYAYDEEPLYVSKKKFDIPDIINLYIIHDSYLGNKIPEDTTFYGIAHLYHKELWDTNWMQTTLDTTKINILLFETAERNFRFFSDSFNLTKQIRFIPAGQTNESGVQEKSNGCRDFFNEMFASFFNKQTNQNLEFNTFDYHFITPIRELKAQINYKLFGHLPNEIVISNDKKYLFLKETVDTTQTLSSYFPLPDEEIKYRVASLNAAYRYYRKAGFDEVYFTIVPNPVSILGTEMSKYNHLIPRISNSPELIMPVIDMTDAYTHAAFPVYYKSDSHWNDNGFTLWLNEFHKRVQEVVRSKKITL
jgi:hypothetical protein